MGRCDIAVSPPGGIKDAAEAAAGADDEEHRRRSEAATLPRTAGVVWRSNPLAAPNVYRRDDCSDQHRHDRIAEELERTPCAGPSGPAICAIAACEHQDDRQQDRRQRNREVPRDRPASFGA